MTGTARSLPAGAGRRPPALAAGMLVVACLLALLPGGWSSPARAAAAPTPAGVDIGFAQRASNAGQAVQVTSAHDGSNRLFVVDRTGIVWMYTVSGGVATRHTYLDLRAKVNSAGGEQGLLGITFYPWFASSPLFWVSYTKADGSLQVSRFRASSARATSVSSAAEVTVLDVPHPVHGNHNAGQLAFDSYGYLLVGTGDGGGAGDPSANAQNLRSLSGKILRIWASKTCGRTQYCIPSTNPFARSTIARHEIWLYGLRNPWRFSVDPSTGVLWIGDVGQDAFEEIDAVAKGYGGVDMGWSCHEAFSVYNSSRCRTGIRYIPPVAAIAHPTAEAIIGGAVYRGATYASLLSGLYVFGDYVTGNVWTLGLGQGFRLNGSLGGITDIGVADNHELWATTLSGGLYQVTATAAP